MKETIEEIVFILLNSDKIKYKLLGIQLASTFDKKNKNEFKVERIKEKLYNKYLEMIDPDSARTLINLDVTIQGLTNYIYDSSFWDMDYYGNFFFHGERLQRTLQGYLPGSETSYQFHRRYNQELSVITDLLNKKEALLSIPSPLKEGENEKLANLLREVFLSESKDLMEVKRLYR